MKREGQHKLAVVLSTHMAQFQAATFQGDLADNLRRIADLGYDGVELAIRDPSLVDGDALQRLAMDHGLEIPAIGTGQAWGEEGLSFTDPDEGVRQAAIARVKAHIPLAAQSNAVIILGLIRGLVRPGVSHEQAMAWLVQALQACCEQAEPLGVRLALEPLNRYETSLINTLDQGLELIRRVGAPNLGLLADTFHMNIEEPSMGASLRQASPRLWHVHVADSNRHYPGGGHLDFGRIWDTLDAMGYAGYVSGEFLPIPDAETAASRAIRYLEALAR